MLDSILGPDSADVRVILMCFFMEFEIVYLREWIEWHLALDPNVAIHLYPSRGLLVDVRNLTRLHARDVELTRVVLRKAWDAVRDTNVDGRVHIMCRSSEGSFLPEDCDQLTDPWLFVTRADQAKAVFVHYLHRHRRSWLFRIDIDEFLEVDEASLPASTFGSIRPLARAMHQFNLLDCESVIVNWRTYGPNGVDSNPTHEVVRKYPLPAAPGCKVNRGTKQLVRLMGNRSTLFNWYLCPACGYPIVPAGAPPGHRAVLVPPFFD